MTIRARATLLTGALMGGVAASIAVAVIRMQRVVLENDALRRREALMEGVSRLAHEAFANRDELMLVSYLMFLKRAHPEMAMATITRRGHTARIGSDSPGLSYMARIVSSRTLPVTYTITAQPTPSGAPPGQVSVTPSGLALTVNGNATVKVTEAPVETMQIRLGFLKAMLDAEVNAALRPLLERTLAIAGGFMVLGLGAAFYSTKLVTEPLTMLASAAVAVGRGKLDVSIPAARDDEVGVVARSFNEMTARLREFNEFRDDLLHTLTHELNTPLSGLKGYLQLWSSAGTAAPREPETLKIMTASVLRMESSLADALNLFSRPSLAPAPLSVVWINELVSEVAALLAPLARAKDIAVELPAPSQLAYAWGNEELIRRVVINLLSNALKYTPDGGRVVLALENAAEQTLLHVSDTGFGIAPENIPLLFTKFYRAHDGRSERIPGTGLGLAVTKQAVEAMGGRIWVESRLREGSVFHVAIPKLPAKAG